MYCLEICVFVVNRFLERKGLFNIMLRMVIVIGGEGRELG